MPYLLQKLPDEPILLFRPGVEYQSAKEMPFAIVAAIAILDIQPASIYLILDSTAAPPLTMDEVVNGMSAITRGPTALFRHPKIKRILVVTFDPARRAAFGRLSTQAFGINPIIIFDTYEEALVYARAGK